MVGGLRGGDKMVALKSLRGAWWLIQPELKGPLKYLVAKLHGCYLRAI